MTGLGFALLAPVPEVHLLSGLDICSSTGKVAFGSSAFEFFRNLDEIRKDEPVEAYIYGSMSSKVGSPRNIMCHRLCPEDRSWSKRCDGSERLVLQKGRVAIATGSFRS